MLTVICSNSVALIALASTQASNAFTALARVTSQVEALQDALGEQHACGSILRMPEQDIP
jgi:hypothetical protein